MDLYVLESQVIDLSFKKIQEENGEEENKNRSFSFDYNIDYYPEEEDVFSITFAMKIIHPKDFNLDLTYTTWFKASELISDEFKKSHFPYINAPAIAFPFLRSFISTITLNAGYTPAILPSINFAQLGEDKQNNIKKDLEKN